MQLHFKRNTYVFVVKYTVADPNFSPTIYFFTKKKYT